MAQLAAYATLFPKIIMELPGAATNPTIMLMELQRAGRELCRQMEIWHEPLEPIPAVEYQQDYTIDHGYDAEIFRLNAVFVNSGWREPATYVLWEGTILRFVDGYTPNNLDDQLLQCGTAGQTTPGSWPADGSVGITVDGSAYALSSLVLNGSTTMDQVALAIQTALRVAIDNNTGFVRYDTNNTRFSIWTRGGEVGYLTAGASGTDISGAGYMNGLSAGTGVSLGGRIDVDLTYLPHLDTDIIPDNILDRNGDGIAAGAVANLAKMQLQPWFSAVVAGEAKLRWNTALTDAGIEKQRQFKNDDLGVGA